MKSEKLDLLATALSKAQSEMPAIPMRSVNPFLKNHYADLATMIEVASPILAKHGLSISQRPTLQGTPEFPLVGVTTTLLHTSGQWIEDAISLPLGDEKGKSLAQVAGSIITYLRRYSYGAIVGLATDEDTDGNAPVKRHEQPAVPYTTGKMSLEMASSEVGGDKKRYGDCTTKELEGKQIGLEKVRKETPDKWTDDHQRKLDAVVTILESRASGSGA